jgi:hypothetical protein
MVSTPELEVMVLRPRTLQEVPGGAQLQAPPSFQQIGEYAYVNFDKMVRRLKNGAKMNILKLNNNYL